MDDDEEKNEDSLRPSEDDALEPQDDIFSPRRDEEHLEEDNDPPAEPAHPHMTTPKLPLNHPGTDTGLDAHELYDEGLTSATDYDAQVEDEDVDEFWALEPQEEEPEEDDESKA